MSKELSKETIKSIIDKATERGYIMYMSNGANNWASFYNERYRTNLQVWFDTEQFEVSHMKGIVLITTTKCGSFMNDEHFTKIERHIRAILFDLL